MIDGLDSYYQRIINNTQQHRLKRNAAKHYKQYENYNYITYTVICVSYRI